MAYIEIAKNSADYTEITKNSSDFFTEGQGWFYIGWFFSWFSRITNDYIEITKN